jgi:hypothetical protein
MSGRGRVAICGAGQRNSPEARWTASCWRVTQHDVAQITNVSCHLLFMVAATKTTERVFLSVSTGTSRVPGKDIRTRTNVARSVRPLRLAHDLQLVLQVGSGSLSWRRTLMVRGPDRRESRMTVVASSRTSLWCCPADLSARAPTPQSLILKDGTRLTGSTDDLTRRSREIDGRPVVEPISEGHCVRAVERPAGSLGQRVAVFRVSPDCPQVVEDIRRGRRWGAENGESLWQREASINGVSRLQSAARNARGIGSDVAGVRQPVVSDAATEADSASVCWCLPSSLTLLYSNSRAAGFLWILASRRTAHPSRETHHEVRDGPSTRAVGSRHPRGDAFNLGLHVYDDAGMLRPACDRIVVARRTRLRRRRTHRPRLVSMAWRRSRAHAGIRNAAITDTIAPNIHRVRARRLSSAIVGGRESTTDLRRLPDRSAPSIPPAKFRIVARGSNCGDRGVRRSERGGLLE